jgi:hypothetical protein
VTAPSTTARKKRHKRDGTPTVAQTRTLYHFTPPCNLPSIILEHSIWPTMYEFQVFMSGGAEKIVGPDDVPSIDTLQ